MIKKAKDFLTITLCLAACGALCAQFQTVSAATVNAVGMCVKIIIPSLFPFFVISDALMSRLNFPQNGICAHLARKIFNLPPCALPALAIGLISGYPVGAAAACSLYENGTISKTDAEQLICFTNNSGPLFLICSVGCGMYGSLQIGLMLYGIHIFTALCTAVIAGRLYTVRERGGALSPQRKFTLAESVENSFMKCIKIIGFVVFFAIITEFLSQAAGGVPIMRNSVFLRAAVISMLEMTNGISRAAAQLPLGDALCLTSFAAAWSGVSVLFQVKSVTKNMLSTKKYVRYKFFSALGATALTSSIFKIGKTEFTLGFCGADEVAAVCAAVLCAAIILGAYTGRKKLSAKSGKEKPCSP